MKTKAEIEKMLEEILSDDRLSEEPADVFVNAPLAIVQVQLEARRDTLRWVLRESVEVNRAVSDEIYTCPTCGARHEDGGRGEPPVYCDECGADWRRL